jgi:hypothetical protein
MRWVNVKFLVNENYIFCDRRYTSLRNFDNTHFFPPLLYVVLENESILVGIFVANPCVSSLNNPFLDPSHIKSQTSQELCSKTNSPPDYWHSPEDVQYVVLLNYRRRLQTSINHSLNQSSYNHFFVTTYKHYFLLLLTPTILLLP